jgi:predicted nucleic acid-binding protein
MAPGKSDAPAGSEQVLDGTSEATAVACSPLGYPEMVSALSRRLREGSVAPDLYARVLEELQRQWDDVVSAAVDARLAGSLAKRYPLSSADAVHLAAVLTLAQAELPVALCSYDRRLNAAALSEGLMVLGTADATP